jgi:TonB family protein
MTMSNSRFYFLVLILIVVSAHGQETTAPRAASPGPPPIQQPVDPGQPVHLGGAVVPPQVLYRAEPEFSEEARRKKISGTVRVYLWVDENGDVSHVRVVQGVGYGLDEQAVDAVRQYKFKPATLNGEPVKVDLYIQVSFQIYDRRQRIP